MLSVYFWFRKFEIDWLKDIGVKDIEQPEICNIKVSINIFNQLTTISKISLFLFCSHFLLSGLAPRSLENGVMILNFRYKTKLPLLWEQEKEKKQNICA